MSAETDWVLDQVATVVDWASANYTIRNGDPVTVKRVDRADSQLYEGSGTVDMTTPLRKRVEELKRAVYIGAKEVSRDRQYIGSGADYRGGPTIRVRLEGMHCSEWGHVDPSGEDGVPFTGADSLVRETQDTLTETISYPSVPDSRGLTVDFEMVNDDNQSGEYADFYAYEFDLIFTEFEER